MSVEIKLPSLGEGVETADVAEVLVQAGDAIEAGQVLMELETDKAVVPVPSEHAGVVESVNVSQGDTITIGQVIVTLGGEANGEDLKAGSESKSQAAVETVSKEESPKPQAPSPKTPAPSPKPVSTAKEAERSDEPSETKSERVTIKLPSLGEGIESADVAEVRVSVGDQVEAGQALLEVETEKAVSEVPSDAAGTVREVLVSQGQTIAVGDGIVVLEATPASAKPAAAKPASKPESKPNESAQRPETAERPTRQPTRPRLENGQRARDAIVIDARKASDQTLPPVPAAPSTRRLARQLGVELRLVSGTGPSGRITREDVQGYVKGQLTGLSRPGDSSMTAARQVGGLMPPPLPDFSKFGKVDREKLNKIGRTAAENLTVSWHVIPHVTHHDRADITDLEVARKRFTTGAGKNVAKVTMTAIVIKALAKCLQGFPKFNSSLDPETYEIVFKRYINIGCAVDTPSGLVVPVIRDCDRKSIVDIAGELNQLAEQARERKLSIENMQGATCTVTNLGGIGGLGFTPIVNYPEVCILGMSRSQNELQLIDGEVKQRLMLPLSLSYDHRVINGADAARFLVAMCGMLSDPFQLLSMI